MPQVIGRRVNNVPLRDYNTNQMSSEVLSVGVPTLAVLVGILINNSRLSDLKSHMDVRFQGTDRRIDDTRDLLRSELRRVETSWTPD